jgi:hypothetical protein
MTRVARVRWRTDLLGDESGENGLSTLARIVGVVVAEYVNDKTGEAWPGVANIAEGINASRRQAQRGLSELTRAGWLEVIVRGDGRGHATVYRLAEPPVKGAPVSRFTAVESTKTVTKPTPKERVKGAPVSPQPENQNRQPEKGVALARASAANPSPARPKASTQQLVAHYVDLQRANGVPDSRDLVGKAARFIGRLVADGVPQALIARAIEIAVERRLDPSLIASCLQEAAAGPPRPRNEHVADRLARHNADYRRRLP